MSSVSGKIYTAYVIIQPFGFIAAKEYTQTAKIADWRKDTW